MPANENEVKALLKIFRDRWPPGCHVLDRPKNEQGLFELGITIEQRQQAIMYLGYKDYIKGPEPDEDGSSGDIWFFKKIVAKVEVYIKLKKWDRDGRTYVKCMSFHPDGMLER